MAVLMRSRRRRLVAATLAAVMIAAGCGSSESATPAGPSTEAPSRASSGASSGTSSPASASASASARTSSTPSAASSRSPAPGDPSSAKVELRVVVAGLEAPLDLVVPPDGTDRLFVLEQAGRIRVVQHGNLVARPFLDVSDEVSSGGERGLLGLAFEPDFGRRGANRFYVNFTDTNGNTVIAEYRASADDPNLADPASARALLHIAQPFANHNGGDLVFGPDRMLYAGLGDGGSGGDPMGNGQRLDTLLGKILRLDPLGVAGTTLAPADNPFVGRAGARPEIWSLGLRNPWRFSFDRSTGDLWIGDVGQNAFEEVDLARRSDGAGRGLNFGWNRMEGAHCYPSGDSCDRRGLTLPVAEYGHDQGCAIVGGYVDRAPDAGPLEGVYVFSDNCSGRVWGLSSGVDGSQRPVVLNDGGRAISSFGEDADGRLYATDLASGDVLSVVGTAR